MEWRGCVQVRAPTRRKRRGRANLGLIISRTSCSPVASNATTRTAPQFVHRVSISGARAGLDLGSLPLHRLDVRRIASLRALLLRALVEVIDADVHGEAKLAESEECALALRGAGLLQRLGRRGVVPDHTSRTLRASTRRPGRACSLQAKSRPAIRRSTCAQVQPIGSMPVSMNAPMAFAAVVQLRPPNAVRS